MLGGFAILCLLPRETADGLERFFEPACALMRDWLAAIFAPGFIALPLAMPVVTASDMATFLALCAVGLVAIVAIWIHRVNVVWLWHLATAHVFFLGPAAVGEPRTYGVSLTYDF